MTTKTYETVGEALEARAERRMVQGSASRRHANVRYAHKKVEPLKPQDFAEKYSERCKRYGKTERDHKNGYHSRNRMRKQLRVAWQKDTSSGAADRFPV